MTAAPVPAEVYRIHGKAIAAWEKPPKRAYAVIQKINVCQGLGFGANPDTKACREAEHLRADAVVCLDKEVSKH